MCLRLANFWRDRFDQHVLAWSPSLTTLEPAFRAATDHVNAMPNDARTHLKQWSWVRHQIAITEPDAILVHCFGVPHLLAAAAARTLGIRSTNAWAGNPPHPDGGARLRDSIVVLTSRLLRCPIVSCSKTVEDEFARLGVGLPSHSATLPNALDIGNIATAAQRVRELRTPPQPVIAMVSRLDTIKDHATLLDAFAMIKRNASNPELWIIGDGPLRPALEAQAHMLGIGASTKFFGNRTDVAPLLGDVDIFAFSTTRSEGFGIVLIEAMAAGVPIVASNVAACREVLADGKAGMLVPAANPDAMASALNHLLASDELRRHYANSGIEHVRSHYSIERCAQRWEAQLFRSTLNLKHVTACAS